ncbi:hypothetical protein GQ53DRAFT_824931 [Thozetella sp. PMI_491]|nr:hypothetical protein GQ53DRAFT_824931 [Thozetella sp. PMI_491]
MSNLTDNETVPHPFRKGDEFELPMPGVRYYPEHPLMHQLNQACTDNELEEFQRLLEEWRGEEDPSPPRGPAGYPLGTVEPCLYHAIRLDRATFVAYLLDQGLKVGRLAAWEASVHKCSSTMWQAFVDHGHFDISAPLEDGGLPPIGYVLDNQASIEWFLAKGADPNAETDWGMTPFLKAVGHAPLSIVKLLHAAGGSLAISVPFVLQPQRISLDKRIKNLRPDFAICWTDLRLSDWDR